MPGASPVLLATLKTCVSTAIVGFENPSFRTTLAVFRPTPGNFSSSSLVLGTWPRCFFNIISQVPIIFRALLGARPIGLMMDSSFLAPHFIKDFASGYRAKRSLVIEFTTLSVDWALNITETNNSKWFRYTISERASGRLLLRLKYS